MVPAAWTTESGAFHRGTESNQREAGPCRPRFFLNGKDFIAPRRSAGHESGPVLCATPFAGWSDEHSAASGRGGALGLEEDFAGAPGPVQSEARSAQGQ